MVAHMCDALVIEGIVHGAAGVQRVAEHDDAMPLAQALLQQLHAARQSQQQTSALKA